MFLEDLALRYFEFLTAPFNNVNMIWILAPLVVTLLADRIYLGYYKYEHLGWNSAISNDVALLFVIMNLIGYVSSKEVLFKNHIITFLVALIFMAVIIALLFGFHKINKKIAFEIGGKHLIIFAYVITVFVYSDFPFDIFSILSGFGIYVLWLVIISFINKVIPGKESAMQSKEYVDDVSQYGIRRSK